jgi:hypothetical protein
MKAPRSLPKSKRKHVCCPKLYGKGAQIAIAHASIYSLSLIMSLPMQRLFALVAAIQVLALWGKTLALEIAECGDCPPVASPGVECVRTLTYYCGEYCPPNASSTTTQTVNTVWYSDSVCPPTHEDPFTGGTVTYTSNGRIGSCPRILGCTFPAVTDLNKCPHPDRNQCCGL